MTSVSPATQEPNPTESIQSALVGGCGGHTVSFYPWELSVQRNLDQWNRIIDSTNLVTDAWNHWAVSTEDVRSFEDAIGNPGLVEVSENYLITAERERSNILSESASGVFSGLATASINLIDAEVKMISHFRDAVLNRNVNAWNGAVDASDSVDLRFNEYERAIEGACRYWESR